MVSLRISLELLGDVITRRNDSLSDSDQCVTTSGAAGNCSKLFCPMPSENERECLLKQNRISGGNSSKDPAHASRPSQLRDIANDLGLTGVTIAALISHAKISVTSKYIHTLDAALIMTAGHN